MTTIRLVFCAGRYHATPWGRHVNEGVTEWPPSPYRLLRALYDVWQRKCPEIQAPAIESLLAALASRQPSFELPRATATHTRSYLSSNSEDPAAKNLVFDAFLALQPESECLICWANLNLTEEQQKTLDRLLANLDYLGRSESWVRAESVSRRELRPELRCDPLHLAEYDGEASPVACAIAPADYNGKKPWLEALTASTADVMKSRMSAPPLLRNVRYVRREGMIETDPLLRVRRPAPDIQALMLGLDSTVLPLATAAIEVAEQIRVRLMGAHRRLKNGDESKVSPLFSGKNPAGSKREDHGHLYILPLSNNSGRIDRVLLVSRLRSFEMDELDAVCGVRELYQSDGRPALNCVITWQGTLGKSGILPRADEVESATPFVTVRHWRRGRDFEQFLEDEVRRECRNHAIPEPVAITRIPDGKIGLFHSIEYRRNRKQDVPRPGYAFRLRFAEPVRTPFSLGYGSHYGLGQFRRCEPSVQTGELKDGTATADQ